ncbi:hypothetical protein [Ralstonia sp. Ralssp135]|uniref:hypothetical protein n=1 Tax=Ralstonia sp. Ralssp135 TaxID=3243016 RepID=UPI0039AF343E
MARKPSGVTGPVRMSVGPEGPRLDHITIQWPADQKGIERKILEYLLRDWKKNGVPLPKVTDGGTEELDFLLEYPRGKAHMELMEAVVPPQKLPFQGGHAWFEAGPYADRVFAGVRRKIAKYGLRHEVPIDLLLYTTHEQYNPTDAALWALARRFADVPHPFEFVYFVTPFADDDGRVDLLYNKDIPRSFPPSSEFETARWLRIVGSEAKLDAQHD